MSNVEIENVLTQMRLVAAQSSNILPEQTVNTDFSQILKDSIDKVNDTQMKAGQLAKAFETGDADADLAEVMVSLEKASISFESMLRVHNKLVDAYQEVMNMPM